MPSNAEQLYEKITLPQYGYDFVASLVERQMQETDWLEFKSADKITDKSAFEHWSKALSGFANTAGGVLIWGIDARRNKDSGIDCANALALVSDADLFAQKLNDVLLTAVVSPLVGIKIMPIKKQGQKEGFVVCLVPEGNNKAHRAELADKQFYMRTTDNFIVPAVAVIRSLFHPVANAYLVPKLEVNPSLKDEQIVLDVSLVNLGKLTATDIFVIIEYIGVLDGGLNHAKNLVSQRTQINGRKVSLNLTSSLHPYMIAPVFAEIIINGVENDSGVTVEIMTFCTNTAPVLWGCTLPYSALIVKGQYDFQVKGKPSE